MNLQLQHHEIFPILGRRQINLDILHGTEKIFSLLYDEPLHTARLESKNARRVFMIYKEGKRNPKHVFKNEYGFDVGMIDPHAAYNDYGCVQLYNNTFYYNLDFLSKRFLNIYNLPDTSPQLTIALDAPKSKSINNLPDDYYKFLLGGLCWYLQLPAKTELLNTNIFGTAHQAALA